MAALVLAVFAAGCARHAEPGRPAAGAPTPQASSASPRPAERPDPGDHRLTLDWQGVAREYDLHAPAGYSATKPVPLVVVLHGRPSSAAAVRQEAHLDPVADRHGFLVAYPEGVAGGFNALTCCGSEDDVGFVRALVEHLVGHWKVDPRRVYAAGFSNGASMTYRLAVEAPGVFAAIAPVSGAFAGQMVTDDEAFKPTKPVSVISILGSVDTIANSIGQGLQIWQRRVGCTAGEPAWVDRARTVSRAVGKCADGSEMVDYRVVGMGHNWPTTTPPEAYAPDPLDAATTIWQFFAVHPRKG